MKKKHYSKKVLWSHVDHTLLSPTATWEDIRRVCQEANLYGAAAVCIPAGWVRPARETFPFLRICAVVGFPLGYDAPETKAFAAKQAISDGADEIDMVLNVGRLKSGEKLACLDEIRLVRDAAKDKILKVIIETCYLTKKEKITACRLVKKGGADYIKTSTGFGTKGAVLKDIRLFKKHIGPNVKIKAAGGIHTKKEMKSFLKAGADRLGMSGAVEALKK